MTKKIILISLQFLIFSSFFSQITITELNTKEEIIFIKPDNYDSTQNWKNFKKNYNYKQYIGLQVYLPPINNPSISNIEEMNECDYFNGKIEKPFLFSLKPQIIIPHNDFANIRCNRKDSELICREEKYDSIISWVYKPTYFKVYCRSYDNKIARAIISTDSSEISNTYFTILNVFYGDSLYNLENKRDLLFSKFEYDEYNVFRNNNYGDKYDLPTHDENGNFSPVFLLKNNKNGDSLYVVCPEKRFILVPFFVKEKSRYEGKKFIYKRLYYNQDVLNEDDFVEEIVKFDLKNTIRYIDPDGKEKLKAKEVKIKAGSIWTCTSVTLLKPTYKLKLILTNEIGEQVAFDPFWYDHGVLREFGELFTEEKKYNQFLSDKKVQIQQLKEKNKQKQIDSEREKVKTAELHKMKCEDLFGSQKGLLISQGKLQLGFTKIMCEYAWGQPLYVNKVSTENGVFEDYQYSWGKSLHFVNGILKRIEE